MKKILSLTLAVIMTLCAFPALGIGVTATEGATLSTSDNAAYADLNAAIENTPDGGTITVNGTYKMPSGYSWTSHGKNVTITGGTFDTTNLSPLNIRDGVTFTNTNLKWSGTVYANGNPLKIDSNVTVTGTLTALYGGGNGSTVASTSLTVLAGNYADIYGGSKGGAINGDTYVYIGGNTNNECTNSDSNHTSTHVIFGGGNGDTIKGDTHITYGENAKASYVYGGSKSSGATIGGTAYLDVTGGYIYSVYGAGSGVDCVKNTRTTITGGSFHQIFGGANGANVTGNVTLRVLGGTISRRIYGGCYNNYGSGWESDYGVKGTIKLILGSGANVTFSASDSDKAVYARSRQKSVVDTHAYLYYSDSSAKSKIKEGRYSRDMVGKLTIGNMNAADKTHNYLTYSSNGDTITESCSCGCGHSATATLKLREGTSLKYTGAAIEPIYVEYSDSWLGEYLSAVTYSNNVNPGTATATAVFNRESLTATTTFDITIGEKAHLMAIANGALSGPLTLSQDISLPECDGAMLLKIAEAVDNGTIALNGHKLTDLSVNISNAAQLSAVREYMQGNFTLTGNIDLEGTVLTAPLLTLNNSTLSGNGYTVYNYSVIDCGLAAICGNVSVSSVNLGYSDNPVSVTSNTVSAAALTANIPEGASLSVKDITVYVNGGGEKSFGAITGSLQGTLTAENVTFAGGGDKKYMLSEDGVSLVEGTPAVCGIQTGLTETVTVDGSDVEVFSVRFIASINDTLDYKRLGLSVRIGEDEAFNKSTSYVYTSLLETTAGGEQNKVTAAELGGAYVYAVIITGIPVGGIAEDGSVTFTVTPYATDNAGNEYLGGTITATYVNGVYTE